MKKSLLIMLPLMSLALVSCHKNSGRLSSLTLPDSFDETQEYNISFWAKNDGNDVQRQIYIDAVEEFEKIYPNIHVEMRQFTKYDDIYRDVLLNISTDTTPNVCIAYPDHVATYMEGGDVVADITQLMNHQSYGLGGTDIKFDSVAKDQIYTKFLEEGKIGDTYYTLPFVRSTEALYINEDYCNKLGVNEIPEYVTWDWIWDVCDKALAYKKNEILNDPSADQVFYPFIYKSTDNMFISMCKQYGYDFTTDDGDVLLFNDNVTDMLLDVGTHAKAGHFETFNRVSYPGNFYNKWECLMCVDSTAGATWLGSDATTHDSANGGNGVSFKTAVRAIPQVDAENPQMISQGPSICVFNKENTQEVIASWIFSQYLLTKDVQLAYSQTEGYLPVTKEATESEEFKAYMADPNEYEVKIAATQLILDNIENTFITPVFNGSSNCRSAANYLIEGIFNEEYQSKDTIQELYTKCIKFKNLTPLLEKKSYIDFSSSVTVKDIDVEYDDRKIYVYNSTDEDIITQYVVVYSKDRELAGGYIAYQFKDSETAEVYSTLYENMTLKNDVLYQSYTQDEIESFAEPFGTTELKSLNKAIKSMKFKEQGSLQIATESILLIVLVGVIWVGIGAYVGFEYYKKKSKR